METTLEVLWSKSKIYISQFQVLGSFATDTYIGRKKIPSLTRRKRNSISKVVFGVWTFSTLFELPLDGWYMHLLVRNMIRFQRFVKKIVWFLKKFKHRMTTKEFIEQTFRTSKATTSTMEKISSFIALICKSWLRGGHFLSISIVKSPIVCWSSAHYEGVND